MRDVHPDGPSDYRSPSWRAVAGNVLARLHHFRHHRITARLPVRAALHHAHEPSAVSVEEVREEQYDAPKAVRTSFFLLTSRCTTSALRLLMKRGRTKAIQ